MNIRHLVIAGSLAFGLCEIEIAQAAIHEDVQSALDWQLSEFECTKPILRGVGIAIVDGSGDRTQTDTDSYTLGRHERKMKRYETCVSDYRQVLNNDFETLKASAQYGLTKKQANTIMGNMKLIQTTIMSLE